MAPAPLGSALDSESYCGLSMLESQRQSMLPACLTNCIPRPQLTVQSKTANIFTSDTNLHYAMRRDNLKWYDIVTLSTPAYIDSSMSCISALYSEVGFSCR